MTIQQIVFAAEPQITNKINYFFLLSSLASIYVMALCGKVFCRHPLPLESVYCDGGEYFYLGGRDSAQDIPPCLFLAGFDQLLLAYRDRSRLLDDRHQPGVVTNTGTIHPTVLVDGRLMVKMAEGRPDAGDCAVRQTDQTAVQADCGFRNSVFAGEVMDVVFINADG